MSLLMSLLELLSGEVSYICEECWLGSPVGVVLEAQQRCSSFRAILVATVSQNSFVLVLMGYRVIIA